MAEDLLSCADELADLHRRIGTTEYVNAIADVSSVIDKYGRYEHRFDAAHRLMRSLVMRLFVYRR